MRQTAAPCSGLCPLCPLHGDTSAPGTVHIAPPIALTPPHDLRRQRRPHDPDPLARRAGFAQQCAGQAQYRGRDDRRRTRKRGLLDLPAVRGNARSPLLALHFADGGRGLSQGGNRRRLVFIGEDGQCERRRYFAEGQRHLWPVSASDDGPHSTLTGASRCKVESMIAPQFDSTCRTLTFSPIHIQLVPGTAAPA